MKLNNTYALNRTRKIVVILTLFYISMISSIDVFSQTDPGYYGPYFSESVWISIDRNIYLPGETIEFSAIVLETDNYLPSQLSKIIKIELIDSNGKQLGQHEFYTEDSRLNNRISIPTTSPGGWYYIRAYTNWMRNSSDALENYIAIKVIDPYTMESHRVNQDEEKIIARIYAENETLQASRENKCALKMASDNGSLIQGTAYLMSSMNDTIVQIEISKSGWSSFSFTPLKNESYRISLNDYPEQLIETIIPDLIEDPVYCILENDSRTIKLNIENCASRELRLLVHRHNSYYHYIKTEPINNSAAFFIDLDKIPIGVCQISIIDNKDSIIFSRLVSKDAVSKEERSIQAKLQDGNRPSLSVNYQSNIREGNKLLNSIVRLEEPLDNSNTFMPGIIGWHFSYNIPVDKNALDAWLIANRYPDDILRSFFPLKGEGPQSVSLRQEISTKDRESIVKYLPDTRGFVLTGSVSDSADSIVDGEIISATILDDNSFYASNIYPSGKFHILIPEHNETEDIIVSFTSLPNKDWNLEIEPRFASTSDKLPNRKYKLTEEEIRYAGKLEINRQLSSIYGQTDLVTKIDTVQDYQHISLIKYPEKITTVNDYIRLNNIRELIYELVPNITVKLEKDVFQMKILGDPPIPTQYKALFLLDGIPIYEYNDFLSLPVDRLLEIRQTNSLYIHGNAVFGGIANFQTLNNDLAGLDLPKESELLSISMPLAGIEWQNKQSDPKTGEKPLLSPTLYRDSFGNPQEGFSLSSNDNPGKYFIRISGYNEIGQWIFSEISLTLNREGLILNDK